MQQTSQKHLMHLDCVLSNGVPLVDSLIIYQACINGNHKQPLNFTNNFGGDMNFIESAYISNAK